MDQPKVGVVIIASLAGLLFGFDTAVISGVTQALREVYQLSDAGLGAAVSAALWGTLLGALAMGKPGDHFGTRDTLRFIGALYLVSALGCALAWNLASFVAFRFAIGIAIGGSSVLAPVYLSEIVPARRRGALVGLFQFNIVLGILVAYLSNFVVAQLRSRGQSLGSGTHWVMNAIISMIFPVVAAWSKPGPFVFFAAMMALQFVLVARYFPETKGVALADMEGVLAGKHR